MSRLAPIGLVAALLAGSAAAFAITERLKLEKTPITRPEISRTFSPLSERGEGANVDFSLRNSDRITVEIVDADGDLVDTLLTDVRHAKGPVTLTWDGLDAAGTPVGEGRYRARVHLARAHRTIVIPNTIRVDLTAPTLTIVSARPRVISPDHDGRAEFVRVRYRVDEPARPLLLVDGRQEGRGRIEADAGKLNWFGRVAGKTLRPGTYTLSLRGEDRAGNISGLTRSVRIRIRYVELPTGPIRATPRSRFRVHVDTDARRLRWRLGGRSGRAESPVLRLRAPAKPGRYTLYVTANAHADKTAVIVARRRP